MHLVSLHCLSVRVSISIPSLQSRAQGSAGGREEACRQKGDDVCSVCQNRRLNIVVLLVLLLQEIIHTDSHCSCFVLYCSLNHPLRFMHMHTHVKLLRIFLLRSHLLESEWLLATTWVSLYLGMMCGGHCAKPVFPKKGWKLC